MFTLTDIISAHNKVQSGADFPVFISDLANLGVSAYEVFASDGHAIYFDIHKFQVTSPVNYPTLPIAPIIDLAKFKSCLSLHQEGKTDYTQFCKDAAQYGVYKWCVSIPERTCAYLDRVGNILMIQRIPF